MKVFCNNSSQFLLLALLLWQHAAEATAPCGAAIKPENRGEPGVHFMDVHHLPPSCDETPAISIMLPDGTTQTFQRNTNNNRRLVGYPGSSHMANHHWRGESGLNTLEYVRSLANSSLIVGSMVDAQNHLVYQISLDANQQETVTVTPSNAFPPEDDAPLSTIGNNGHSSLRRLGSRPLALATSNTSSSLRGRFDAMGMYPSDDTNARGLQQLDDGSVIDIMVVWTRASECRNSGLGRSCSTTVTTEQNMRSLINLAVAETNTAYELSGVLTQLRLVHAYRDGSYNENNMMDALEDITGTSDGNMDEVHAKRVQYAADAVALLVDISGSCGVAWLGPIKSRMFSVTAWNCATGYFTFGHEIGHNLGCEHDKGTTNRCSSSDYNYGWRDPQGDFRSVLAYSCQSGQCDNNAGGGCTRVQRFSNSNLMYNGKPMGNAQTDNARHINDVRLRVSQYFTSIEPPPNPSSGGKLVTTLDENNGSNGNMFRIEAKSADVYITQLEIHADGSGEVEVYMKNDSYEGFENSPNAWTSILSQTIAALPVGQFTALLPFSEPVFLESGGSKSFYVRTSNGVKYTNGVSEGRVFVENDFLRFYEGKGVSGTFGNVFFPRIFNGVIHFSTEEAPSPTATPTSPPSPAPITASPVVPPPPTNGLWQSIQTTLLQNNGSNGNMFRVQAKQELLITQMDLHLEDNGQVEIFVKDGTYDGFTSSSAGWKSIHVETVNYAAPVGQFTTLSAFANPVRLEADETKSFYVRTANGVKYTNGVSESNVYVENDDLRIFEGIGVRDFGATFSPRVWNGVVRYSLVPDAGPPPTALPTSQPTTSQPTLSPVQPTSAPLQVQPTAAPVPEVEDPKTLDTTLLENNGSNGNMFKIVAVEDISITKLEIHASGNGEVEVFVLDGSYVGAEANPSAWTSIHKEVVSNAKPVGQYTPLSAFAQAVEIAAGSTKSFYVTTSNGVKYTNGQSEDNIYAENNHLKIYEGIGLREFGAVFRPRVFNGKLHYLADSPQSLSTTFNENNGSNGNQFDIRSKDEETLYITGLTLHLEIPGLVEVYTKSGSYQGFEQSSSAWTLIHTDTLNTVNGNGQETPLTPFVNPVVVPAGEMISLYVRTENGLRYTNGRGEGLVFAQDSDIEISEGVGINGAFGAIYRPRVWNGRILYKH